MRRVGLFSADKTISVELRLRVVRVVRVTLRRSGLETSLSLRSIEFDCQWKGGREWREGEGGGGRGRQPRMM